MRPGRWLGVVAAVWAASTIAAAQTDRSSLPNLKAFDDPTGVLRTYSTQGAIDLEGLFFQSLGTNGRACGTCHQAATGWTVTPESIEARFDATDGLDPIFRTNDGSVSPNADVSTVAARREAYRMLLSKGLIRVGIGLPAERDFDLIAVDDPYGYASAAELSLFRRPLPSTNLLFLSTVMWDGRETFPGESLHFDLSDQANSATLGHAAAVVPLTTVQQDAIVAFETSLFTAQAFDVDAGNLDAAGAAGGPAPLPTFLGASISPDPFDPPPFTLFDAWIGAEGDGRGEARAAVARGEAIFNTRPIVITGVNGLNDALGMTEITGTCTTCHNTANVGNHSVPLPIDIGVAAASRRTPDLPLYTFESRVTGEVIQTTDPGRALITGAFRDMSKFKGPILRGLAARAPYFHNGSAATLADIVEFYNERFGLGLSGQEKADLIAFLRSL